MLIQNEYCDGGSLESVIETKMKEGSAFPEEEALKILKHVCLGLRSLHGTAVTPPLTFNPLPRGDRVVHASALPQRGVRGANRQCLIPGRYQINLIYADMRNSNHMLFTGKRLAHLDIKPGNVFLKSEEATDTDTPRAESPPDATPRGLGAGAGAGAGVSRGGAAAAAFPPLGQGGGAAMQSPLPQAMDISPAIAVGAEGRARSDAFSMDQRPPSFVVTPSSLGGGGGGGAARLSVAAAASRAATAAFRSSAGVGGAGAMGVVLRPTHQNIMRAPSTPREGSIRPMETVYKIGDLGHVTRTDEPTVEEGDTRYLAKELLAENYRNLTKADIFSTGIMVHELAACNPLPMNGGDWHKLRDGSAPHLPRYSANFNNLIQRMLHPDPTQRPSANSVLSHPALVQERKVPGLQKSKTQLYNELNAEKMDKFKIMAELQTLKQKDPLARVITQGGRGSGLHRRNSAPSRPMRHSSACW